MIIVLLYIVFMLGFDKRVGIDIYYDWYVYFFKLLLVKIKDVGNE